MHAFLFKETLGQTPGTKMNTRKIRAKRCYIRKGPNLLPRSDGGTVLVPVLVLALFLHLGYLVEVARLALLLQ